ncbi:Cna B-type domain-containing protein [Agathobacter sp.]
MVWIKGKTDDEIKKLIDDKTITLVDTTHLTGSKSEGNDKTQYSFPDSNVTNDELKNGLICEVGDEYMLPEFDAAGNRYTYLVRETITDSVASQLYSQIGSNGTLSNVFKSNVNRRSITVTKKWKGRDNLTDNYKKYPSVTYTLYRYEAGNEEKTKTKIETHTLNSDQFTGENGQASYTFSNLLVYSPAGVQYFYYIEEKAINGYSISYEDEEAITEENSSLIGTKVKTGLNSDGTQKELEITKEMLEELKANKRIDIISLPDNWNKENATVNTTVSTTNTYNNPGKITLSGEKVWNDYGNMEGLRPGGDESDVNKFNVTLKRHTNNESGQQNKVDITQIDLESKTQKDDKATNPYIVWNRGNDAKTSSQWTYTIYNLERYAPNGMPYTYTLSEDQVTGYKQAANVSASANSDEIKMPTMTNSFDGTYYVRKNWMDGDNKYNLRPENITVVLQRKTENEKNWQNIEWKDSYGSFDMNTKKWTGLPSVTKDEAGNSIVSINLTKENVIKNTKGNSWEYTFTNLPTQDKEGKPYTYRCIETAIGGVTVKGNKQDDTGQSEKYTAGAYERIYTKQDESETVIENTLDSTSLVVTKKWEGDNDDKYHSRPDELTFKLQKKSVSKNENSEAGTSDPKGEWKDVMMSDGKTPYTFTVSKKDNWTKTLEYLPTAEVTVDKDGNTTTIYSLYFRAVEVDKEYGTDASGEKIYKPDGALNYRDITDYSDGSAAHTYNKDKSCNESTITNQLIEDSTPKTITVNKTWRRVAGEDKKAIFELLYKKSEDDTDSWHCYGGSSLSSDNEAKHTKTDKCLTQEVSSTDASSTPLRVEWTNLPKYDREGNLLEYKVIEHPVGNYKTEVTTEEDTTQNKTIYNFTNIELQSYTVEKIWQNESYAQKTDKGFTATFKLQQQIEKTDSTSQSGWTDVKDEKGNLKTITLTAVSAKPIPAPTGTWDNLPKFTTAGEQITYRAVETHINGITVDENTNSNGSYIASYKYGNATSADQTSPQFGDTQTVVTNRMIYGFVNLSKKAAYLAPGITDVENTNTEKVSLQGIKFDIYRLDGLDNKEVLYASDIVTDANGNLQNENGKYGKEKRYLIAGTYILQETNAGSDYSVWDNGVRFTVGLSKTDQSATGEHGTAWISTEKQTIGSGASQNKLVLKTVYINPTVTNHSYGDKCVSATNESAAVNLESRGVLTFTKTGPASGSENTALDTHGHASGENSAYFGVYLDADCTKQVAGMVPSSGKTTMILTDKAQNGTTLQTLNNVNDIPYLRAYNDGGGNYPFTLLSGTYYIKELVAPAGYKLDKTVRVATIKKIGTTGIDTDLTVVYPSNAAKIKKSGPDEQLGTDNYQWSNEPNKVTIYKLDQYGRKVQLAENGYLELKADGTDMTFPSGEDTIRLYQDTKKPATKTDGTTPVSNISYKSETGTWTIEGLFDAGKTYILSEPPESVHANYMVATSIRFKVNADGTIAPSDNNTNITAKDKPTQATGTDTDNYYKADASDNIIVMRDVCRNLKDVSLQKIESGTDHSIANISFELYKYERDANGNIKDEKSVLDQNVYLTTNDKGEIDLANMPDGDNGVKNQITGCALRHGLDIGKYYFKEVERGASDKYRLSDPIYFEIKPSGDGNADNATVEFDITDSSHISVDGNNSKMVIVKNDPVTSRSKTLELTKVDSNNDQTKLAGARFTLDYVSITKDQTGATTSQSWNCVTDQDGVLYLADENWNITDPKQKPDISQKGTYTLKEVQAPAGYMTRTDENGPVTMAAFKVDSDNRITEVNYYSGTGNLAAGQVDTDSHTGEDNALRITVKNEKTTISASKRTAENESLIGATLEVYETGSSNPVMTLDSSKSGWDLVGLKENTIYTLHESNAPVGYMKAADIYFKLSGTTTKDNNVVSQLYIWDGNGQPDITTGNSWEKASIICS